MHQEIQVGDDVVFDDERVDEMFSPRDFDIEFDEEREEC